MKYKPRSEDEAESRIKATLKRHGISLGQSNIPNGSQIKMGYHGLNTGKNSGATSTRGKRNERV